jgi:hypothetical protein
VFRGSRDNREPEDQRILKERKRLREEREEKRRKREKQNFDRDDDHLSLFVSILAPCKFYDDEKYSRIERLKGERKKKGFFANDKEILQPSNSIYAYIDPSITKKKVPNSEQQQRLIISKRSPMSFSQACSILFPVGFLISGHWATDLFEFNERRGDHDPPVLLRESASNFCTQSSTLCNRTVGDFLLVHPSINRPSPSAPNASLPIPSNTHLSLYQLSMLSYNYPISLVPRTTASVERPHCCLKRGICRLYNPIYDQLLRRINSDIERV